MPVRAQRAFKALCASTHLYGRRLVLEWAAADDDVDTLRMKTAAHFAGSDGTRGTGHTASPGCGGPSDT